MKIVKVNAKSSGRVLGALYMAIGLIGGLIFGSIIIFTSRGGIASIVLGLGAIVVLPLLYGVLGLLAGYIFAWLYNAAAKRVGGIEFETE